MLAVARNGDTCTGHAGFPPRAALSGSPNVFINGRAAHRVGDEWATHCAGSSCHSSTLAAGSAKVFVNGQPLGRIGDAIACGSAVAAGSANVFAGG